MYQKRGTLSHKRWVCVCLAAVLLLTALPAALAANQTGTIQNSKGELVNLRAWAGMDAPVLCTLRVGTKVEITGKSGSWFNVWAGGTLGYVHESMVDVGGSQSGGHSGGRSGGHGGQSDGKSGGHSSGNAGGQSGGKTGGQSSGQSAQKTATVICDTYLRESASKNACWLAKLSKGTKVTIVKEGGTWTQVKYGSCTGYVLTSALDIAKPAPAPNPTPKPVPKPEPAKPSKPAWQPPAKPQKPTAPIVTKNANATVRTFNGGNLNLRTWTSLNADVLASIPNGTRICILTHGATWCKVQVGSLTGYMSTKYLVFDGGNPHFDSKPNTSGKNASVQANSASVRKSPGSNSGILTKLHFGAPVQLLGIGTEWARVNANGKQGYVKTDSLTLPAGVSPHKTVVNNGSYVNLRSGAGYEYSVLKRVSHGAAATVVIPYEIWSKVIVKDGQGYLGGYMMNNFLR